MPATKQSTMEKNRMTTSPAQGMRRKAIPAEWQDVAIGGREGVSTLLELIVFKAWHGLGLARMAGVELQPSVQPHRGRSQRK